MNPPAPQLMSTQQRMLDELRAAPNVEFDRTCIRQQIPAHEVALALHSNYARSGDTGSLRAAASGAVPIITSIAAGAADETIGCQAARRATALAHSAG